MHSSATANSALALTVGRISFALSLTPPSTHRFDSCSFLAMVADSSSATYRARQHPAVLCGRRLNEAEEHLRFWGGKERRHLR